MGSDRNKDIKISWIAPVIKALHWLPLSCNKSLIGFGPEYIMVILEYKPSRALTSANLGQLVDSRFQSKARRNGIYGSCYAVCQCEKLPTEVKSAPSINAFKVLLKTCIFCTFLEDLILYHISEHTNLSTAYSKFAPCAGMTTLSITWKMPKKQVQ